MTEAIKATTPTDLAKVRKASVREFVERGPSFAIRLTIAADEAPSWWTPRRDIYLRKFWPSEPFLAGAIYSIASRNASFRYEFTGPERQVKKCQEMFAQADLGDGWQSMMMKLTIDLLTQDNGSCLEVIRPARARTKSLAGGKWLEAVKIGHDGWSVILPDNHLASLDGYDYELKDSPVDLPIGIAHLDAGRITRTGDPDYPVTYRDLKGAAHKLSWWQVITFEDMPSPNEEMLGVGYSFVTRILRLAQTLRDIEVLKGEKAAGRFAGRIYLTNVGGDAVQDAIEESKEAADNRGLTRYMPPIIASTLAPGEIPGVATIDLASLPEGFNEEETLRWYIAGLALGGGTDYGFLAPLPGKGLGTSAQSETQERQARGKSSRLFMKMIEHKFNYSGILPRSVEFKFQEVDPQEEAETEAAKQNRAKTRALRIESGEINPQIARQMAADDGDLEQKYLELLGEEDLTPEVTVTDTDKPESDKPKAKPEAAVEAEPAATETPPESQEKGGSGSGWFGPPKGTHAPGSQSAAIMGLPSLEVRRRVRDDVVEVQKYGISSGNEAASAFDSEGKRIDSIPTGTSDSADVGPLIGRDSFVLVHNHPSSSSFSDADTTLLFVTNLQHLVVVGHDGTLYRLSRTPRTKDFPRRYSDRLIASEVSDKWDSNRAGLTKKYWAKIKAGEITPYGAQKEHTHEAMTDLAIELGLDYERVLP